MFDDVKTPNTSPTPLPEPVPPSSGSSSFGNQTDGGSLPKEIEVPRGAIKPSSSVRMIHTIPQEYYGVAPKTAMKKEEPAAKQSAPPPPPPPKPVLPPKPIPPTAPGLPKKKKKVPIILIIGILFLAVVGVGGYLFVRSLDQPVSPPVVVDEPPEPLPEPPPPEPPSPPLPEPIRPGIDTDSDGLTDVEERTIYGSNIYNPDTDGDSFIDGNEILHLYSPVGGGSRLLLEDQGMEVVEPPQGPYSFIYPKTWAIEVLEAGAPNMDIKVPTGEIIHVMVHDRDSHEPPLSWSGVDVGTGTGFSRQKTKSGMEEIRSEDGRTVYLSRPEANDVVELQYDLGEVRTIDFLRTFEMIINSFFVQ